jgi:dephospho-CoA kinase
VAGRCCAGKNTLVEVLKRHGFREIDVDRVGHEVLEERRDLVAARFGPAILAPDGRVDRRTLGRRVFAEPASRRALEAILHPAMVERISRMVADATGPLVINAAILIPMGLDRLCDLVICVTAPFWLRLARCMARDRLSLSAALRRITAQRGICLKPADRPVDIYYVRNGRDRGGIESAVLRLLQKRGMRRQTNGNTG